MKYIKLLIVFVTVCMISSCASIQLNEIPKKSRILVLTNTTDKFVLVSANKKRKDKSVDIKAPWLLSELFVDFVMENANKERFNFVRDLRNNLNMINVRFGSEIKERLIDISKYNEADYVLYLETTPVWNSYGIVLESHYGYYDPSATMYMNATIYLVDVSSLDVDSAFNFEPRLGCGIQTWGLFKGEDIFIGLPHKGSGFVNSRAITEKKKSEIFDLAKNSYEKTFSESLKDCGLL